MPYDNFESGVWENVPVIEDFIRYHNHESSLDYDPDATVRAIAVPVKNVNDHFLLVETGRLRDIYDGTDTLFVQSCAMVIAGSIQDGLLRQALEAKTTFLRNAQHAFRTSLNGVLSATDMLLGAQTSIPAGKETVSMGGQGKALSASSLGSAGLEETTPLDLLRIIETSGRGLLTVINHLIDLDAQTVEAKLDICDIHDIEEEVLDSIVQHSSKDKMKDILLISDSRLDSKTGDCIITDRLLLRQTIAALVQNAVEATSEGGTVIITIRLTDEGPTSSTLDIEVRDSGTGIDHVRPHIADKNVTADTECLYDARRTIMTVFFNLLRRSILIQPTLVLAYLLPVSMQQPSARLSRLFKVLLASDLPSFSASRTPFLPQA